MLMFNKRGFEIPSGEYFCLVPSESCALRSFSLASGGNDLLGINLNLDADNLQKETLALNLEKHLFGTNWLLVIGNWQLETSLTPTRKSLWRPFVDGNSGLKLSCQFLAKDILEYEMTLEGMVG